MSINFEPLRETLKRRDLNLNYLRKPRTEGGLGLSSMTTNKISHDDPVSFEVLDTICREMNLKVEEVIKFADGPFQRAPMRKRAYEIPEFLERSNNDMIHYLELYKALGQAAVAYRTFWENKHITPPNPWHSTLNDVPMVCSQVHPTGGRHILGMNALDSILNALPSAQKKVVVWLVPWPKGIEQTIKMFRIILKKNRSKLNPSFPNNVEIYSAEQLVSENTFAQSVTDNILSIIVLCCEHFASVEKDEKQLRSEIVHVIDIADLLRTLKLLHPVLVLDELRTTTGDWFSDVNTMLSPSFIIELTTKPSTMSNIISIVDSEGEI